MRWRRSPRPGPRLAWRGNTRRRSAARFGHYNAWRGITRLGGVRRVWCPWFPARGRIRACRPRPPQPLPNMQPYMEFEEILGYSEGLAAPARAIPLAPQEPAMHHLVLTPEQRHEMIVLRDTAPKAYLRERAAALLKIADGMSAAMVARSGLLRPRKPATVWRWLQRYRAEGRSPGACTIRDGRGRKPAFSPLAPAQGRPRTPSSTARPRPAPARLGRSALDPGRCRRRLPSGCREWGLAALWSGWGSRASGAAPICTARMPSYAAKRAGIRALLVAAPPAPVGRRSSLRRWYGRSPTDPGTTPLKRPAAAPTPAR